jgi:hypothetical protein
VPILSGTDACMTTTYLPPEFEGKYEGDIEVCRQQIERASVENNTDNLCSYHDPVPLCVCACVHVCWLLPLSSGMAHSGFEV